MAWKNVIIIFLNVKHNLLTWLFAACLLFLFIFEDMATVHRCWSHCFLLGFFSDYKKKKVPFEAVWRKWFKTQHYTIPYLLTFTSFEKECAAAATAALVIDRSKMWDFLMATTMCWYTRHFSREPTFAVQQSNTRKRHAPTVSYWQVSSSSLIEVSWGKRWFGIVTWSGKKIRKRREVENQTPWLWVMNVCLLQSIPRGLWGMRGAEEEEEVCLNQHVF